MRCRVPFPFPATAADIPAPRIYLPEIPADSLETGNYKTETSCNSQEIAADIAEIGTYMKEIAGCSLETRIAFMEATPDWSEIATDTPETGNYRKKMADNAVKITPAV
ncbi:MAG: hypothetical protein RL514_4089 [Verrucomicrobiota bacterium]